MKSMQSSINIMMVPSPSPWNPYMRLLTDALRCQGVGIRFGNSSSRWFPVRSTIWRGQRPQLIHLQWAHNFMLGKRASSTAVRSGSFVANLMLAKQAGLRLVWTVHNIVNHEGHQAALELRFNRIIARLADSIIVHYPEAREIVADAYRVSDDRKIEAIPHGHYLDAYPNTVGRTEARKILALGECETVFLFLGLVRPYKQLPELIESFKQLRSPDARLLIAGNVVGSSTKALKSACEEDRRISPRFEFVPDEEIQLYMNASDAVVLPFAQGMTSGSAVLAMSFGKAVIAADSPHLRFLGAGVENLFYDPGDRVGLGHALWHASDRDLATVGMRNRERIATFGWQKAAVATRKVYEAVLGRAGG